MQQTWRGSHACRLLHPSKFRPNASLHLPLVGPPRYNAYQILGDIGGLITAGETSHH
jgi:hypothetical protein